MSTRTRAVALGLLAAFVLACLALMAWRLTAPDETTDRVTLSVDGVHWTPELEGALFESDSLWPPGQTRTAIFWVRNDADVRADIDLYVTSTGGEDLIASGLLVVSASVEDGDDVQPFVTGRDVNTVRVGELESGQRATVTLLAELAGTVEVDSGDVRYRISGSGVRAEETRWRLDSTGAHLELAPVFLGVALLMTAWVMRRSRRPRHRSRPRR